jgi:hypothetical protein
MGAAAGAALGVGTAAVLPEWFATTAEGSPPLIMALAAAATTEGFGAVE